MSCLYAAAAGSSSGSSCWGILPFIERLFRITTSMTLLELADGGQPLLRRLAMEALTGTYNHSLQVATAEAAAEAVGATLLCRVGAYYHDVGKMNKADYFIENQRASTAGEPPPQPLPSVSLLIIIGHVKDGVELGAEYNLPTSLFPSSSTTVRRWSNSSTTRRARRTSVAAVRPGGERAQYRYPGPKPRTRRSRSSCSPTPSRAPPAP